MEYGDSLAEDEAWCAAAAAYTSAIAVLDWMELRVKREGLGRPLRGSNEERRRQVRHCNCRRFPFTHRPERAGIGPRNVADYPQAPCAAAGRSNCCLCRGARL